MLAHEADWLRSQIPAVARSLWIAPQTQSGFTLPSVSAVLSLDSSASGDLLSGDLLCAQDAWPVASDSLDSVVMQHLGESARPMAILLAEAIRSLRSEGELWLFGCGPISVARMHIGVDGRCLMATTSPGRMVQALRGLGAVDIELRALRQQGKGLAARSGAGADWYSEIILIHARKRQNANILRPRRQQAFATMPLPPLGASPAAREALAA